VELDRELDFVKDYFYLQQIRDGNKIRLEIEKFPITDDWILPISLQLLVENALKHNMATPETPLVITIGRGENHTVVVRNHLMKKMTMGNSSGLGLKNLGQRLRLSAGRDLEITETQDEFMVKLPLIAR
jgi:LytS/YehU family sensor histidine kinase